MTVSYTYLLHDLDEKFLAESIHDELLKNYLDELFKLNAFRVQYEMLAHLLL